jgi:hypothetical protein
MFGYVHKSRLELAEARVVDLQNMLGRMEKELTYWRGRADDERERADRIADADRLDRGLNEVSSTVLGEKKAKSVQIDADLHEHEKEVAEMFADNFDAQDDLNWVDPDLAVTAAGWMEQAKAARALKEKK